MASKSVDAAGKQQKESSMADVYNHELTPLQQHAAFFDRNKDGIIYPSETYQGESVTPPCRLICRRCSLSQKCFRFCFSGPPFPQTQTRQGLRLLRIPSYVQLQRGLRAIGCGVVVSAVGAVFINSFVGPKTVPENVKAPAFKLPIYIQNIQKGKHGSDTDAYDTHGRFVPEKFEEIFKKHAHTKPDALTDKELQELLRANREPKDLKGWAAAFGEWKLIYSLCKDKEGFLHKDTVRSIYDGTIFVKLEQERKEAKELAKIK